MSRQVRHRLTGALMGGVLLSVLLTNGMANGMANAAEPSPPAGPRSHPAQVTATERTPPSHAIPRRSGPASGLTPRIKSPAKRARHGTGSSAPTHTRKLPSTRKAGVRRVPTLDLPSRTHSAPAAPARAQPDIAAEPVARADPTTQNGQIGLLAAVSIVLVLGVSIGVFRAIVSQRASRTKIA